MPSAREYWKPFTKRRARHPRSLRAKGRGVARRLALAAMLMMSAASPTLAVQPDEILKDPALERRARHISSDLRCLVCQNQSIDESDAPLAKDLRVLVRERLSAGDSDAEVRNFVVRRYGEFVLLRPRFGLHTALLWLAPALVLALGAFGLARALRRRHAPAGGDALTAEEQAALAKALATDEVPAPKS
jgi:cytochrome c-type biogenesis protein CcmH